MLYLDASEGSSAYDLDAHCEVSPCVGTVIVFKNKLYYDAHFEHFAGVALGQCIVVAEHPDPLFYCVYTSVVEDHGEIAVQGYGSQSPDGSTFLITAAADEYAGLGGSLTSTPLNEENTKYLYEFEFF